MGKTNYKQKTHVTSQCGVLHSHVIAIIKVCFFFSNQK